MVKEIHGDLFTSQALIIGHGVNTKGVMGAGIAVAFKNNYPDMFKKYRERCKNSVLTPGRVFVYHAYGGRYVANMATQDNPGKHARLEWVEECSTKVARFAVKKSIPTVALPRIGCGIGGLNWEDVREVLEQIEQNTGVEFEVYYL